MNSDLAYDYSLTVTAGFMRCFDIVINSEENFFKLNCSNSGKMFT